MKLCPKCGKRFSDDANFCPVDAARLTLLEGTEAAAAASGPLGVSGSLGASGASGSIDTLAARFDLRERLGGDRTGTVCRAVDKQTQATVAVKILTATLSPTAEQRVERELKQLERLQHSGIAKVMASGKRGEQLWVATELVEGARTLSDVVRSHGPLSATQAAELVELIGEALIEAAQVGVVHHDLAPKNVLLAGNELKLINFSVAVPGTDATPGVPEFVAPEQVEGKPADQRSNIYSLGTLFYYALTGRTPFEGEPAVVRAGHTTGTITPPSQLVTIAPELEAVILRSLERMPSKRFLTVRQLVDEVVRVSRGGENLKSTQPLGRAGKPKAEVVQTLLGMPGDQLRSAAAALKAKEAAAAAAAAAEVASGGARAPTTVGAVPAPAGPEAAVPAVTASGLQAMPALAASLLSPEVEAAPTQATPVISTAPLATGDRSPWAPPGGGGATAAAVAPALAAVAPAPAAVAQAAAVAVPASQAVPAAAAAPQAAAIAAPTVGSASPSGSSRRKRPDSSKSKDKFRETLWFKKGDLDAAAAQAAAVERARTGKDADRDKADSLPMDERYKDDGSLSNTDHDRYSLKTGGTQAMPVLKDRGGTGGDVSEDELIDEMKAGRGKYVVAILLALVTLGALVVLVMR